MAIGLHTAGTWAAVNATTQTRTLPTHSAGDMLIVRAGMKHATMPGNITCATAGWARIDQHNSGTGASSNGGGDVQIAAFWKVATSGAETSPVITWHATVAATPGCAVADAYSKGAGETWETPVADGGNISVATSYSATMATHISATAGDWLVGFVITNDNTTLTVPTMAQTGLTLAAVVEHPATALSSGTSNDIAADGCYRIASSGTSSAAATFSGTNSVADIGAAMVIRLRATAAAPIQVDPTAGALTLTGVPPTVAVTNNVLVEPTAGALTLTGVAPTVTAIGTASSQPTASALTLTTATPTVEAIGTAESLPTAASLTLATATPTVDAQMSVDAQPTATALTLATSTPFVEAIGTAESLPTASAVALTTATPDVEAIGTALSEPTASSLTLTTATPAVELVALQEPTAAALSLAGGTPFVEAIGTAMSLPTSAALSLATGTPDVEAIGTAESLPTAAALSLTTATPQVTIGTDDSILVEPTAAALTLTPATPSVTVTTGTYAFPTPASLLMTAMAPDVVLTDNRLVLPTPARLTLRTSRPAVSPSNPSPTGTPAREFAPLERSGFLVTGMMRIRIPVPHVKGDAVVDDDELALELLLLS